MWFLCFSVYSSAEPAVYPKETVCGVLRSSGIEFVVGRFTFNKEAVGASAGAFVELLTSL